MHKTFDLMDMGEPSKIVRIEITQGKDCITISQSKYVEAIWKCEFGTDNAHAVKMPMDLNTKLEPNPNGVKGNWSNTYAQLVSSLMFLTTATHPDIAYVISQLSAYMANPTTAHYGAAKRVLQYVMGTKNYGLTYRRSETHLKGEDLFYGYTNAAYANADYYHSMSGYVFIASGRAITWSSKSKQQLHYHQPKPNMLLFPRQHAKPHGSETCIASSVST